MIPRTQYQKEVAAVGFNLSAEPPKQVVEWARRNTINHYAYRLRSGKAVCLDCGHEFVFDKVGGEICCPHCHAKLEVQTTTKSTFKDKSYFSYLTTVNGLQVVRSYRLDAVFHKGKMPKYEMYEICRHFINDKGKVEVIGVPRAMGHYLDSFALYSGELDLRNDNDCYRYVASCFLAPYRHTSPVVRKHGFKGNCGSCGVVDLLQAILSNPIYETMIKNGDLNVLSHFVACGYHTVDDYWAEYKVAHRNHYKFTDVQMWCDMINALRYCERDTHNPHFICPDNLQTAHDYWIDKANTKRSQKKRKEERERARVAQAHFNEVKSKFFGLTITDGLINIGVVDKVDDFYRLGDDMHICLGRMRYYEKDSSLILLARAGNEIKEVIELSLDTLKVIQSRSYCNQPSEYHDRIVKLLEDNVKVVAQRKAA